MLRDRAPDQPRYVQCEHEMHGHYTRCLIAHAMSVIGRYCTVYQMFTDPSVYTFMWSLHPSRRTDAIYATLLEQLDPRLARLPWARTNRALRGRTLGRRTDLRRGFHDYEAWLSGPLFEELHDLVDPEWLAGTGLFDPTAVRALSRVVERGPRPGPELHGVTPWELWSWLACFRRLARWLEAEGRAVALGSDSVARAGRSGAPTPAHRVSTARRLLRSWPPLHTAYIRARRRLLSARARLRYPPRRGEPPRGTRSGG
jgi:asparagine synthase (glutamine-hydrolysing)